MLFAEQLLRHHTFSVDAAAIPEVKWPKPGLPAVPYQLHHVGDRYYDFYPPGNVILSVPFVAIANAAGYFVTDENGLHNQRHEDKIQLNLAALLMAALAVTIFFTGRVFLPFGWSMLVAGTIAFGTQIWSSASRALWSQTWGIFLLGFVIWLLVRAEGRRSPLHPIILGTCLSWLYFVRPTFALTIMAVAVYVLIYQRRSFVALVLAGLGWLIVFVVFSKLVFGQTQPHYYYQHGLRFRIFWEALGRNLVSPSRGLLVYVPILLFVFYLLVRYRPPGGPGMVVMASVVIVLHLAVISLFGRRGGHCYGPRLTTDLVPWFALLGILAVDARLQWQQGNSHREPGFRRQAEACFAGLLIVCSITLNGIGAVRTNAWWWNLFPADINKTPARVWDWKHPQFLGVPADWRDHVEPTPVIPPG